jgi:CheY-like chemotaxis protein
MSDRLERALSAAGVGAWSLDRETGEFWCDTRGREVLGLPAHDGPSLEALLAAVHPNDVLKVQAVLRAPHDVGAPLLTEFRVVGDQGRERRVELVGRVMGGQAEGVCLEVAGRRREDAAQPDGAGTCRMARTRNELLAGISHELRTPVNEILGMIQLATDPGMAGRERVQYLRRILESGREFLDLVREIMDVARLESEGESLCVIGFSPRELARQVAGEASSLEAGPECVVEVERDVPETVVGEPSLLRRALLDLLEGLQQLQPTGPVRLRVESAGAAGRGALVFILQAELAQDETDIVPRRTGAPPVGKLPELIVGLMGGSVWTEAREGAASMVVSLPCTEDPQVAEAEPPPAARPLKILLVEDNPTNKLMLKKMLERMGHNVATTDNGREALEVLQTEPADVVLMDVQMPEMDGLEATRIIRGGGVPNVAPAIPIVAVTAHAMQGDRERFLAEGMNAYISKPVDRDMLERVLDSVAPGAGPPDS